MRRVAKGVSRYVVNAAEPFIVPSVHAHGEEKNNRRGLVSALLAKHYTGVVGSDVRDPLGTITSIDHHSFVTAHMIRHFGESIGSGADEPVGTITAGGQGKTGLVMANLARHFGKSDAADVCAPMSTITSKSKDGLVTSHLIKLRGTCADGQPVTEPAPTITAGGLHVGEVRSLLQKYSDKNASLEEWEPLGMVAVNGEQYRIVDIGMRMLSPRELFTAQGFPLDYIIDRDKSGRPVTKTEQVKRCGNSVSPFPAEALVRANMCRPAVKAKSAIPMFSEMSGQIAVNC
jgi:DNA (cytosine-5)-methyltransferase 1